MPCLWAAVIPTVLAAGAVPAGSSDRSFERSYACRGFEVRVAEGRGEARSIGSYTITVIRADRTVAVVTGHRDGTIQDVWVTGLRGDGGLDVAIVTQSSGSGSYGALAIHRWTGTALTSLNVADLSPAQKQGYRGHDVFRLDCALVVRAFQFTDRMILMLSLPGGRGGSSMISSIIGGLAVGEGVAHLRRILAGRR